MKFQTGIDDLGAGYSGSERVVLLRADYLKLDMHMVRDIDTSAVKQDIMHAFCTMAEKVGAAVVAEGWRRRTSSRPFATSASTTSRASTSPVRPPAFTPTSMSKPDPGADSEAL